MKICCVSDLHGYTVDIPDCDLLLLGGDYQTNKYGLLEWQAVYQPWIDEIANRGIKIIGVAGNHDWMFYRNRENINPVNWVYLEDSGYEFNNYYIWGTPWQPTFYDWAFNLDEEDLRQKWELIPYNTDILLLHGPPRGYGDLLPPEYSVTPNSRTGSPSLTKKIAEIQPKLVVCGHIHNGYGIYQFNNTIVVNAAILGENYKPKNKPIVLEI